VKEKREKKDFFVFFLLRKSGFFLPLVKFSCFFFLPRPFLKSIEMLSLFFSLFFSSFSFI